MSINNRLSFVAAISHYQPSNYGHNRLSDNEMWHFVLYLPENFMKSQKKFRFKITFNSSSSLINFSHSHSIAIRQLRGENSNKQKEYLFQSQEYLSATWSNRFWWWLTRCHVNFISLSSISLFLVTLFPPITENEFLMFFRLDTSNFCPNSNPCWLLHR